GTVDKKIAQDVLSQPHWKEHPELVEALIKKGTVDKKIAQDVLSQPHWNEHPELVEALIKKGTADKEIAWSVLGGPHWKAHPELVEALIKKGTIDKKIAQYILCQPHWNEHPELVEALIKKGTVDKKIAQDVLSQPHWKNYYSKLMFQDDLAQVTPANIRKFLNEKGKVLGEIRFAVKSNDARKIALYLQNEQHRKLLKSCVGENSAGILDQLADNLSNLK
ncbi:MAG: hypothetical protein HQK50_17925, partial [Oligoflexia bacterium]|nr:hypothetical protein [Oligoflexia bacterium]